MSVVVRQCFWQVFGVTDFARNVFGLVVLQKQPDVFIEVLACVAFVAGQNSCARIILCDKEKCKQFLTLMVLQQITYENPIGLVGRSPVEGHL